MCYYAPTLAYTCGHTTGGDFLGFCMPKLDLMEATGMAVPPHNNTTPPMMRPLMCNTCQPRIRGRVVLGEKGNSKVNRNDRASD